MKLIEDESPYLVTSKEEISLDGSALTELLREACRKEASLRFKARGFSMSPFIKDGDILTVSSIEGKPVNPGNVVAFKCRRNNKLVIHRAVARKKDRYLIKGDNCTQADCPTKRQDILGVVVKVEREGKDIRFGIGPEQAAIAFLSRIKLFPFFFRFWWPLKKSLRKCAKWITLF